MTAADKIKALPLPEPTLEDHEHELWGQNVRSDFYTAAQMRSLIDAAASIAARQDAVMAQMVEALRQKVEDAEHAAWESWAEHERPSGDVESVRRQWEQSPNYGEFAARWSLQIAALRAHKEIE